MTSFADSPTNPKGTAGSLTGDERFRGEASTYLLGSIRGIGCSDSRMAKGLGVKISSKIGIQGKEGG